jgi:cytochrome c oxidase cbb3-type subunit 2
MEPQIHQSGGKTILGAVITVAAVYVYFLIFAQFGFLKAVQAAWGEGAGVIRPVMAVMGLAGVAGSVLAAQVFDGQRSWRRLAIGLGICAGGAAGSMAVQTMAGYYGAALLTGLGTGLVTVTLAAILRPAVGDARLGLTIGLGTGLAYAFCNLPAVFTAGATTQALVALLAVAAGLAGGRTLLPRFAVDPLIGGDYAKGGVAVWVLVFLALVALDSSAFYIIQHTSALKENLWDGSGRLGLNAGMHLTAALLAGWALDRRWLGRMLLLGAAALVAACLLLNEPAGASAVAGLLYVAGVSVYSVALVFYPAWSGRPALAALVYAVAGWGGSALGIGLAEGRSQLPSGPVIGAGTLILLGLLYRPAISGKENDKAAPR